MGNETSTDPGKHSSKYLAVFSPPERVKLQKLYESLQPDQKKKVDLGKEQLKVSMLTYLTYLTYLTLTNTTLLNRLTEFELYSITFLPDGISLPDGIFLPDLSMRLDGQVPFFFRNIWKLL